MDRAGLARSLDLGSVCDRCNASPRPGAGGGSGRRSEIESDDGFLDGLQQFSVNSQSTVEELHESGHRIDRDFATSLSVKRPNKLRAARAGNSKDPRFFYDGKNMTLYS